MSRWFKSVNVLDAIEVGFKTGRSLDLAPNVNGRARQHYESHRTKVKFNSVCYCNLGGVSTCRDHQCQVYLVYSLECLLEWQQSDGIRGAT